ncbi:GtrA family protein [Nakamurella deserti]|uniref:GtrA family protein n=1 Tax=Nakamurella deserti TaxID=2164074 RepID=UPI000DBE504E|nr:GtrA family protein [Nakamurella deserti]
MTLTAGPLEHLSAAARRRALTFLAVGAVCTPAYLGLYAGLRTVLAAGTANVLAQLVTTLMSTAANRRFTMHVTGSHRALRHHLEMIGVLVLGLAVNDLALDLLAQAAPDAGSVAEMVVLLASGGVATAVRVALMTRWRSAPAARDRAPVSVEAGGTRPAGPGRLIGRPAAVGGSSSAAADPGPTHPHGRDGGAHPAVVSSRSAGRPCRQLFSPVSSQEPRVLHDLSAQRIPDARPVGGSRNGEHRRQGLPPRHAGGRWPRRRRRQP